ncbi:hypothetical protein BC831DRAFT_452974 [Entophlyctis helioformis]|nr:hypothetical protein BC831DRAFT_452974 [Entophlyctis helioformis]
MTTSDPTAGMDALLDLETMFENSGWEDGYRDGVKAGLLEGQVFGSEKGFQFGFEAGFYGGMAELWRLVLSTSSSPSTPSSDLGLPSKTLKQVELLAESAARFPKDNARDADPQLDIERLRGRYRTATTLLKVSEPGFRPANTQQPGLSF